MSALSEEALLKIMGITEIYSDILFEFCENPSGY